MTTNIPSDMKSKKSPEHIIFEWWAENIAPRDRPRPKALSSVLRNRDDLIAISQPEVQEIAIFLQMTSSFQIERLLLILRVLSYVRYNDSLSLPARLAKSSVSKLGFQAIQRAKGPKIYDCLCRAVRRVDGTCNVIRLANDLLYWETDKDKRYFRWASDFLSAISAE